MGFKFLRGSDCFIGLAGCGFGGGRLGAGGFGILQGFLTTFISGVTSFLLIATIATLPLNIASKAAIFVSASALANCPRIAFRAARMSLRAGLVMLIFSSRG